MNEAKLVDSLNVPEADLGWHYRMKYNFRNGTIYFNPIFHERFEKNPFNAPVRHYPVEMPFCINNIYVLNMDIPRGYRVDQLPKSQRVKLEDSSGIFEYLISADDSAIHFRTQLTILNSAAVDGLTAALYLARAPWRPPVIVQVPRDGMVKLPPEAYEGGPFRVLLRVGDPGAVTDWPGWPGRDSYACAAPGIPLGADLEEEAHRSLPRVLNHPRMSPAESHSNFKSLRCEFRWTRFPLLPPELFW